MRPLPQHMAGGLHAVERVKIALWYMPLASVPELAALLGLTTKTVRAALNELERQKASICRRLGAGKRRQQRWRLSWEAARTVGLGDPGWTTPWGLAILLRRLRVAEDFYSYAAQSYPGQVYRFLWADRSPVDAILYEGFADWHVMVWSGHWESESDLGKRLVAVTDDLQRMALIPQAATAPIRPYPSSWIVVVSDPWQMEVAKRASMRAGIADTVRIALVSQASRLRDPGAADPQNSSDLRAGNGVVWPQLQQRAGGKGWAKSLEESLATRDDSWMLHRALDLVSEWPGAWLTELGKLGGGENLRRLGAAFDQLVMLKMARLDSESGVNRLGIEDAGLLVVARRDRVDPDASAGASRALTWQRFRDQRDHEDWVIRTMAPFGAVGLAVASGWRCDEDFPGGGVNPDAMVHLPSAPYGPGWYYVECERRMNKDAQGVVEKLGRYADPKRWRYFLGDGEPNPLLCMVVDEAMERLIHEQFGNTPILTMARTRWNAKNPFQDWSQAGVMVNLHGRDEGR